MDPKTPTAENLRSLPYSELKKLAKIKGIKSNMKAEKLIAALTSADSDSDSFSTPAAKVLNSCKKNKEAKFIEDKMTPLVTPRRGTYSLETPASVKVEDIPEIAVPKTLNLDESNVTVERGSERKLRSRKVSFLSPVRTPQTPKNSSLKLRPQTPVAPVLFVSEHVSPSPVAPARRDQDEKVRQGLTPKQQLFPSEEKDNIEPLPGTDTSSKKKKMSTPGAETSKKIKLSTPGIANASDTLVDSSMKKKESAIPRPTRSSGFAGNSAAKKKLLATPSVVPVSGTTSSNKKRISTPGLTKSARNSAVAEDSAAKKKRLTTPNFKKIHEKAFEKLESIDEYQKRRLESAKKVKQPVLNKVTKAKSKISTFSGINFVPSVPSSLKSKLNISTNKCDAAKNKSKTETEGIVKKKKFDLKASLSRKLGYKPYTGALKPLAESNKLDTSQSCVHKAKELENSLVKEKRFQNRNALKGVRTNKRFDLQMKNRQLV